MITKQTQSESYQSILPGLLDARATVLEAVRSFSDGATAEQIADAIGKPTYQARPRLTELLKEGKVHVIRKDMSPVTGRNIAVFKVA